MVTHKQIVRLACVWAKAARTLDSVGIDVDCGDATPEEGRAAEDAYEAAQDALLAAVEEYAEALEEKKS